MKIEKKQYVLVHAEPYFPNADNKVLLVMKDRPEWQKGFFNLVGGKVEPGEEIETAVLRELEEETGYKPHYYAKDCPMDRMGTIETDDGLIHCYRVPVDDYVQPEPRPRKGETEVVRWYPWHMVRDDKRLIPSLRIVLPFMLARMYDWNLYFDDSYMTEGEQIVKVTIQSHKHERFKEKNGVTNILDKNRPDSKWECIL